jgi:hypothetical protein
MGAADQTTPGTVKKRIKRKKAPPKPAYKLPSNFKTQAAADRPRKQQAGPIRPQQTGAKSKRKQPILRKPNAPSSVTDTTSDARRSPAQKRRDAQVVAQNIATARRQVVAKQGKGAIVKQAKKELEGRGALAKGLGKLGDYAEKVAVLQGTGGGPGAARLSLKATGRQISPGAATALAPKPIRVKGTGAGRALKDVVNFPAQALPSVYVPVAGAVEAAKGRPQRIKQFAKDIDKTDPIYNLGAAGVEAVQGKGKQARERLGRAAKAASEHPGFTAIEALGVKGAVGRGAGAVARSGAVGKTVKRAASTERAPRVAPGTNIREERVHSRDVITKAAVVGVERAKRRSAQRLEAKARSATPEQARALRDKAARRSPARLSEHEIRRQVDERVAVNEDVRRAHRAKTVSQARQVVRKAQRGGAATSVVAQRITRANRTDLQAYVDQLANEFGGLSNSGKRANKTLRRELQKVIDDPKADMAAVESAATEYRKLIQPLERKLVKRGLLGAGQEAKAKLIPYAVRHMGARHESEARLTPTGVQKFIAKEERSLSEKGVKRASKTETGARRQLREAVTGARVSAARSKSSAGLRAAQRDERAAQATLARTRRSEQANRRQVAVRRSRAELATSKTQREFFRADEAYVEIEKELRAANAEKRRLREEVRQANGTGKKGPTASLAAASERSRALAARLSSRADELRSEALVRIVKDKRVLAPRARVLRAQRKEIAPKATETKPAEVVARAKRRVEEAGRVVARERSRIRGVDPKSHDRLLRAIATHDEAKAMLKDARAVAEQRKTRHIEVKKASRGKSDTEIPGMVDEHGRKLSTEAIRQHMRESGVAEPAFITQAPNARGARNFNVRSERPVAISNARRTGEATRKGTFDAHPETLVEGAARAQGLVDATDGFRRTVKDFAVRHPDTRRVRRFKTYREAAQAARDLVHDHTGEPVPGAIALRPVRLNPFGAKKEQLDKLLEHVDSLDQPQAQALVDSMREGLTGTKGKGPWALIPEAAAKRLEEHLNSQGGSGGIKTLQVANQAFRKTVLATSTTWLAGNVIEGLGRAALARAGPRSYIRGRGALKGLERIDPKAAEEAAHRIVGGGHFASAEKLHVRRGAEQFEATRLAPLASALGKFWRTPGPKQAAQMWNAWTEFVFHTVNGRLESKIQTAMLGRALKDSGLRAIQDAASGLRETPAQIRFGREVDRMYGRYSKLSPAERRLITTYTPFIAWARNAAYFVTRTLPRDHPVALAVIASSEQATEEWRKNEGLDLFITGALPGFLQGSIPTGKGGHQRISRYTPFGAFGDPTDTAASQVMPLVSGVLAAFKGQDWKGQELRVKGADGKSRPANPIERAVFAAGAFVDATIPVVSQAKRLHDLGPRALDPFRDVKPATKKTTKKIRTVHHTSRPSSSSSPGSFFGGSSGSGSSSGGSFFGP